MGYPARVRTRWTVLPAALVAVATVAVIGAWRVLGTSDDREGFAVVTVRDGSGQLLVSDLDGEEIDTFDTGFQRVENVSVRSRYAIAHNGSVIRQAAMIVDLIASKAVWEGDLRDGHELAWLPGSSAAVAVIRGTGRERGGAMLIDATTGQEHQLGIPGLSELSVDASPDGRWIAAGHVNDGDPAVSMVDLDGRSTELRQTRFEAMTDDTLATGNLAGVLTLRDRDGAVRGNPPVDLGRPGSRMQVLAVTAPDTVVGIDAADGITTIWESTIGAAQPSKLARIDTGKEQQTSRVIVQPDTGRLVVPSDGGKSTVLNLAGDVLGVVPGTPIQRSPKTSTGIADAVSPLSTATPSGCSISTTPPCSHPALPLPDCGPPRPTAAPRRQGGPCSPARVHTSCPTQPGRYPFDRSPRTVRSSYAVTTGAARCSSWPISRRDLWSSTERRQGSSCDPD